LIDFFDFEEIKTNAYSKVCNINFLSIFNINFLLTTVNI